MTTSDLVLIALSVIVIGGLYFAGWYSRKSRQRDVADKEKQ